MHLWRLAGLVLTFTSAGVWSSAWLEQGQEPDAHQVCHVRTQSLATKVTVGASHLLIRHHLDLFSDTSWLDAVPMRRFIF